jgi:uncharacterized membrane protein (DUF4010 family)
VLYLDRWASNRFGSSGTLFTSALFGLTDVDALIYSMLKLGISEELMLVAAQALAIGVLSNTLFKLGLVLTIGHGKVRAVAGFGLASLALASLAALVAPLLLASSG